MFLQVSISTDIKLSFNFPQKSFLVTNSNWNFFETYKKMAIEFFDPKIYKKVRNLRFSKFQSEKKQISKTNLPPRLSRKFEI
jgi:hypothetical protein